MIKTQHSQDILINDIGQRPFDIIIIERYNRVESKNLKNAVKRLEDSLKISTKISTKEGEKDTQVEVVERK